MRKKKTIVEETIPDETLDTLEPDLSEVTDHYKLYKLNGASKAFCYQSREPIDEAMIQDQYPMGGKFIVYSFTVDKVVLTSEQCEIEPKPLNLNAPIQHQNSNGNAAEIQVRMLLDELKFSRDMILTMLNNKGGEQTPIGELVKAFQGMRELSPSAKDPIDLLVKGMEMASKFSGGGSESWKDVIATTAKDLIGPALNAYGAMKQNPPTVIPYTPAQIEEQPAMLQDMFIKKGLQWLKQRILAGMEPYVAVNWLTSANDPMFEPFITKAVNGSIQTFIDMDNELANEPYRGWFTEAIALLKDYYAESNDANVEDNSDYDGGNGNGSNVANDANVSSRRPKVAKAM